MSFHEGLWGFVGGIGEGAAQVGAAGLGTWVAVAAFGLALMLYAFGPRSQAEATLRLQGFATMLVVSLALFANNALVYLVAVFIIASMITRTDYLQNLAALAFNRDWWGKPATEQELKDKIEDELPDLPPGPPGGGVQDVLGRVLRTGGQMPEARREAIQRALDYERDVLNALLARGVFSRGELQGAYKVQGPGGKDYVMDGLASTPQGDVVIEARLTKDKRGVDSAIAKVQELMRAMQGARQAQQGALRTVRGLVVVPKGLAKGARPPRDVLVVDFDADARDFVGDVEPLKGFLAGEMAGWVRP